MEWQLHLCPGQHSSRASTEGWPKGCLILSIKERTVTQGIVGFQESFSEMQRVLLALCALPAEVAHSHVSFLEVGTSKI